MRELDLAARKPSRASSPVQLVCMALALALLALLLRIASTVDLTFGSNLPGATIANAELGDAPGTRIS